MKKSILVNAFIAGSLVVLVVLLFGCLQKPPEPIPGDTVWLSIIPKQCQGNAWEKWHKDQNNVYIRALTEKEVIAEWLNAVYKARLLDYKSIQIYEVVCLACSCPRGDKVFIKVSKEDAGRLNWVREEPPEESTVTLEIGRKAYYPEDKITASAKATGEINIYYKSWKVSRLEKGNWVTIYDGPSCQLSDCNGINACGSTIACSMPSTGCIKKKESNFEWVAKESTGRTISCIPYWGTQPIQWTCSQYSNSMPGKYKISFEYALDCNGEFPKINAKTIEEEFEILPPAEPPKEYCTEDSDCIKTVLGCCPCTSGGKEIAVNKQWLAQQLQSGCEGIMCAEVFMCTEREAKCLQGKCVLE